GRITDTALISRSLIFSFLPHIANSLPANLQFEVNPPEVRPVLHINIDDTVLSSIPESYLVPNGVHQLSFEAEGYSTETVSMHFAGGETYRIRLDMHEKTLDAISLALKRDAAGMFLINAMPVKGPPVTVEVSGQSVLGVFDPGEDGVPGYFVIPPEAQNAPGKTWTVQPNTADATAKIEKSRKIMYVSYSAFMTSLPVLAYFLGEYQQHGFAYQNGFEGADEYSRWLLYRNISIGATVTTAVNFFSWLFVYLYQANGVVPVTAKAEKY
ncbi:MAG: hypothetical protein LBS97_06055, partial [Treponema sp.]|nr:hypothetical protein [Treponema sp.]